MKIKRRALALLLSLAIMLTFMPALAFADNGEGSDRGNPTSLEIVPSGSYTAYCYYNEDGYYDEDENWIKTSDSYLYYYEPYFNEGDKAIIRYENLPDPITYTAVIDEEGFARFVNGDESIVLGRQWVREQSYDAQFMADSTESFRAYCSFWTDEDDEEQLLYSNELSAYLDSYEYEDEGNEFSGNIVISGTISSGETKDVSIENPYDYASFEFIPTVSGTYCFRSDCTRGDPYGRVLSSDMDTIEQDDYDGDNDVYNFAISFYAEAGKTYYLQACMYGDGTGSFTVELLSGEHEPLNPGGEEYYNTTYTAEYYGNPYISVSPDGENVDIVPAPNDYVIIHKDDEEIRCEFDLKYNEYSDSYDYVLVNTNENDNNFINYFSGWYVSPTEAEIEISGYSYDEYNNYVWWYASGTLKNVNVYNEVSKIDFRPVSNTVYSEDIKTDEDGTTYLSLWKRSNHSAGGQTWYSRFAVGDKLVVYYADGRTKTFINKNVYDDYEEEWYDEFYCGDERIYVYMYPESDLKAGNNTIKVEYHARTTTFTLIVETPESRKAAEKAAADKAAAEKAAADKAAADKAAADKAAAEKAAADKAAAEQAAAEQAELAKTAAGTTHTVSNSKYKVLTNVSGANSGTVAFITAKNVKSVTVPATVKLNGKTFKVTQVNANAFKGKKIRTVTIGKNVKTIKKNAFKKSPATKIILKTKLLKKAMVKGCLKGSKIKTVQVKAGSKSQNKKTVKSYKKIFTKANVGKTVIVK